MQLLLGPGSKQIREADGGKLQCLAALALARSGRAEKVGGCCCTELRISSCERLCDRNPAKQLWLKRCCFVAGHSSCGCPAS